MKANAALGSCLNQVDVGRVKQMAIRSADFERRRCRQALGARRALILVYRWIDIEVD